MNVVLLLWRSRLRSSWRSAVALAAVIALGAGIALAVAAGARRTASAYDAILTATDAPDLAADYGPEDPRQIEATVRSIQGVAGTNLWVGFSGVPDGDPQRDAIDVIGFWEEPVLVGRPIVTAGRFPTGPNETMLSETASAALGLGTGDHLALALTDGSYSAFEQVDLDIVGVGFFTDEVVRDERNVIEGVIVPRAFTERHLDKTIWGQARIRVDHGANPGDVAQALAGASIFVDESIDEDRARVQDSLRPILLALVGLAGLAAVATVLETGQTLSRIVRLRREEDRSLLALGCTTSQLRGADLAYAAAVVAVGVGLAVALAVAASPAFPVGPVRRAQLLQGVDVDGFALGAGSALLALALMGVVGFGSWRRRADARPPSAGRLPGIFSGGPTVTAGLRLATSQRAFGATVAGVASGLVIVVAAMVLTSSLNRLIHDQALVGMTWDAGGRAAFDEVDLDQVRSVVGQDPVFQRATGLAYHNGTIDGTAVPVAVLDPIKGSPWPPVVAGRAPQAANEVLVGRATLTTLGIDIGDTIDLGLQEDLEATGPGRARLVTQSYSVVGSAVAPAIGEVGNDTPRLDVGLLLSTAALGEMASRARFPSVLFDLTKGTDPQTAMDRFPDGLPVSGGSATEWFTSAAPAEVSQAKAARTVVWFGVGALALTIVGTIVHTLLGSVRQRRRDYAVLKAIGFTRGQVRATVLTQSGAILGLGLLVALPVGVASGRWLWRAFAQGLGIVASPLVPLLLLGASMVAIVVVVQGAAMVPAIVARRTPVARSLRSE